MPLHSKPVQQNLRHLQGVHLEVCALKVSETQITTEKAFNQDPYGMGGYHDSYNDKKPYFSYFCRFVTRQLTHRTRKT